MKIVSDERYKELLTAFETLSALEAGGVDNWEWYSDSINDSIVDANGKVLIEGVRIDHSLLGTCVYLECTYEAHLEGGWEVLVKTRHGEEAYTSSTRCHILVEKEQ